MPWLTISIEHSLAERHQLGDHAQVIVGDVDGHQLHGLVDLAVDLPGYDLGLAHRQLKTLAAHGLDQHGQLELAPPLDLPGVGALGGEHARVTRFRPARTLAG